MDRILHSPYSRIILSFAVAVLASVLFLAVSKSKKSKKKQGVLWLLLGAAALGYGLNGLLDTLPGNRILNLPAAVLQQPWSVAIGWGVVLFVLIASLLINRASILRFADVPGKFQALLEGCCEVFAARSAKKHAAKPAAALQEPEEQGAAAGNDKQKDAGETAKKNRKRLRNGIIAAAWILCGVLLTQIQPLFHSSAHEGLNISITSAKYALFTVFGRPFYVTDTIISTWIIMAVLAAAAITVRLLVIPKFESVPGPIQNFLETIVEYANGYTRGKVGNLSDDLPGYIVTLGALLVASSVMEAIGLHSPTLDLTFTLALAVMTFVLINYYGIKKKGVRGRLSHYIKPAPFVAPIKLLSDIAVPISMACRLFGNMLGGLIVMELIYIALGNYVTGVAAVLGLFFNVFHPLIQAFIFITLTLTFIEEAVE